MVHGWCSRGLQTIQSTIRNRGYPRILGLEPNQSEPLGAPLNSEDGGCGEKEWDIQSSEVRYACRNWICLPPHVEFGDEAIIQAMLLWFEAMRLLMYDVPSLL